MRASKETWLEEGLQVLSNEGANGLTIDNLARKLGLTKGSFYHHFKGRTEFQEELLGHWERQNTSRPIELTEEALGPLDKFNVLANLAVELPQGPEIAIRSWALHDPVARKYQEKVDGRRYDYLVQLIEEITADRERANIIASMILTVFIGSQQVVPPIQGEELRQVLNEIRDHHLKLS